MHRIVLKDKVQINRTPAELWRFLQSPARMKDWNPKIKAVVRVSSGEPSEGYRCRIRREMSGKQGNFLAEIMEYQEPSRLLIHFTGGGLPRKGYMQEIYELTPNAQGTLLVQRTEIYTSGRHIFSGYLAAFIHFFGKLSKKRYLVTLKKLAENT
ncbi:MAG: SRPBCC family protein [Nitrospirota bacterium]|nr:SRPBCC family protein [Nitrospirota bacterium]